MPVDDFNNSIKSGEDAHRFFYYKSEYGQELVRLDRDGIRKLQNTTNIVNLGPEKLEFLLPEKPQSPRNVRFKITMYFNSGLVLSDTTKTVFMN